MCPGAESPWRATGLCLRGESSHSIGSNFGLASSLLVLSQASFEGPSFVLSDAEEIAKKTVAIVLTFVWTQSRDLERGEELLLRYNEDSDADFFAYACGLD